MPMMIDVVFADSQMRGTIAERTYHLQTCSASHSEALPSFHPTLELVVLDIPVVKYPLIQMPYLAYHFRHPISRRFINDQVNDIRCRAEICTSGSGNRS